MSYQQLPSPVEQSIERFAHDHHISHDEAVLYLIETGLQQTPSAVQFEQPEGSVAENAGAISPENDEPLHAAIASRHRHLKRGPQPPLRTDSPERIIGLFADSPDTVDSILQEVESRSERYAS
jgi:hypothetical protein